MECVASGRVDLGDMNAQTVMDLLCRVNGILTHVDTPQNENDSAFESAAYACRN
jgi:hypothetical protein